MAHTDVKPEAFLQRLLDHMTWCVRVRLVSVFEPLTDGVTYLVRMPMSAVLHPCISLDSHFLPESIGGRATDLQICLPGCFLPCLTCLHEGDHLPSCSRVLLFVHSSSFPLSN